MGEVIKIRSYEPAKTALKGLKTAALALLGVGCGAVLATLQNPEAMSVLLGQAKLPASLAVAIPAIVAAILNWNKNKDN
jgi:hypothetical protein